MPRSGGGASPSGMATGRFEMRYHFFKIPVHFSEKAQDELNNFCASHRVATVEKEFSENGGDSFWAVCVTYIENSWKPETSRKGRIDYREILDEKDFSIFAKLRTLRKNLADNEGVPAYAIFTNEQLATMSRERVKTPGALSAIKGVGKMRVEKYGQGFLAMLKKEANPSEANETGIKGRDETSQN